MVFGGDIAAGNNGSNLAWAPMVKPGYTSKTSWYIVTMDSMSVGGKKLATTSSSWKTGYGGAVIDTGTTDMMLPRRLFDLFNNAIIDWLKSKGDFHHYYDRIEGNMCFKGTADTPWDTLFPDFSITFENGISLQLYAYNYILDVTPTVQCLSVFTNSGGVILGSNTLLNVLLVFDRKNWKMGFAPSECNGPADYGNALSITAPDTTLHDEVVTHREAAVDDRTSETGAQSHEERTEAPITPVEATPEPSSDAREQKAKAAGDVSPPKHPFPAAVGGGTTPAPGAAPAKEALVNKSLDVPFILFVSVLSLATLGFVVWYFGMRKPVQPTTAEDLPSDEIELVVSRQERRALINNSV